MEGFPGIKTLDDDQALEYWTGKASKHGRGNLQEDDLDVGSLVIIKGVAPDTTGDMPWDAPRTQLVGHSARVLANSDLPTPVGPRNRKEPEGRLGSLSPTLARLTARTSALTASF